MIASRSFVTLALSLMAFSLIGRPAKAIPLPDNSSCSSTTCVTITNTRASPSTAIYGVATSSGSSGVVGVGHQGVYGASSTGIGVLASAQTDNGLRAYTSSTTAAAVSALSPSSSGLAFYGGGGILITGSAEKPGGGPWTASSDARIKKDVKALQWGIEELRQVRPVTFKYNGLGGSQDDGREYTGVIAQELEKILPAMVTSRKAKLKQSDSDETDIRIVDPSAFTYVLINAVKEQQQVIERQEMRLSALERERGTLGASIVGGELGRGIALGLLPLAFLALNRRKKSST
jgi:hypothetical protein